jgi:hypothetical protein
MASSAAPDNNGPLRFTKRAFTLWTVRGSDIARNASAVYLPFIRRHSRNASARIPCRNASAHNPDRNAFAHNLDRNAFARSRDPRHVWEHCRFVQKPRGTDR